MIFHDIRFSLRLIQKYRGLTFLAIATLAVGIGLNIAVFSVVNAVLLRPMPYPDFEKLMLIQTSAPNFPMVPVSYPDFLDWKSQAQSFSGMATYRITNASMTGDGLPERISLKLVSASYFNVIGIPLLKGRDFNDQDDRVGAPRVAIISYGFWERKFGLDPGILGRTLTLDDASYTVVGIASPEMAIQHTDVWAPIGPLVDSFYQGRGHRFNGVTARLAPGVTRTEAQAEMKTIAARLASEFPLSNAYAGARVDAVSDLWFGGIKRPLRLLLAGAGMVLLLACLNVSAAFVVTVRDRRKELVSRLALGAGCWALMRQLLVQILLFATFGSIAGLALAWGGMRMILAIFPTALPRMNETNLDATVLAYTVALIFAVTLFAGIWPALYVGRLAGDQSIRDMSGRSGTSKSGMAAQRTLIGLQVGLATALSLIAGLFVKSLYKVTHVDTGFDINQVLSFQIALPEKRYPQVPSMYRFYDRLIRDLKIVPGVTSTSAVSKLPLGGEYYYVVFEAEGHPTPEGTPKPMVDGLVVPPAYFSTLHIPMLQGRDFTDADGPEGRKVAIVDDALAAKFWPGENPIGKRIKLVPDVSATAPWIEVVGVAREVKQYGPEQPVPRFQVYTPLAQRPLRTMTLVLGYNKDQGSIKETVKRKAFEIDRDLPLYNFHTLDDLHAQATGDRKLSLGIIGTFAGVSMMLTIIGIYGVVSDAVVRRRREIAIRLAMGATFTRASILLTSPILLWSAVGAATGVVLVLAFTRLIASFLFDVSPHDSITFSASLVITIVVACVACIVPSLQVRAVDPQEILRE